ncbi:MAG: signal peptidase II [Acidobacteria bacterium]|nr:signal peptidase II [Acidobacteriota bacterium]
MIYVLIAVTVFLADQATKALVVKLIPDHAVIPVISGFFNLLRTENSGIAFSLFANSSSSWKMALLIGVSVALLVTVVIVVWRSGDIHWQAGVGLALILGGAISNLVDRIRFGQVVDFLDFYYRGYHWPTFNLADSAVVVGAGFLVLEFIFSK